MESSNGDPVEHWLETLSDKPQDKWVERPQDSSAENQGVEDSNRRTPPPAVIDALGIKREIEAGKRIIGTVVKDDDGFKFDADYIRNKDSTDGNPAFYYTIDHLSDEQLSKFEDAAASKHKLIMQTSFPKKFDESTQVEVSKMPSHSLAETGTVVETDGGFTFKGDQIRNIHKRDGTFDYNENLTDDQRAAFQNAAQKGLKLAIIDFSPADVNSQTKIVVIQDVGTVIAEDEHFRFKGFTSNPKATHGDTSFYFERDHHAITESKDRPIEENEPREGKITSTQREIFQLAAETNRQVAMINSSPQNFDQKTELLLTNTPGRTLERVAPLPPSPTNKPKEANLKRGRDDDGLTPWAKRLRSSQKPFSMPGPSYKGR